MRENLIIELDGAPHGEYHRILEDENRDKYIESLGFTVIRFENRDKSINHPGRDQSLQYIDYNSTPATPPSKGGETFVISVLPIQPLG